MQRLTMGGNAPLNLTRFEILVEWPATSGTLDTSAYLLDANGKVRSDTDMIFFNQRSDPAGAVRITAIEDDRTCYAFDLQMMPPEIDRIVICVTIDGDGRTMAAFQGSGAQVRANGEALLGFFPELHSASEAAMQLVEIYRRNGAWKMRANGQGFNQGLAALARSFGIEVGEDDAAAPASVPQPVPATYVSGPDTAAVTIVPTVPASPARSLADSTPPRGVRLDQHSPHYDLRFAAPVSPGILIAQLAWTSQCGSGHWRARPLELALGCLYRLQDGRSGVIQPRDYEGLISRSPFVQLHTREGELPNFAQKLRINADHWSAIERCVIFAFVVNGAPNWRASSIDFAISTSANERIPIECGEGPDGLPVLALAKLEFSDSAISIMRLGQYYSGHRELAADQGWDLPWRNG